MSRSPLRIDKDIFDFSICLNYSIGAKLAKNAGDQGKS
jgi:hypothetical protein